MGRIRLGLDDLIKMGAATEPPPDAASPESPKKEVDEKQQLEIDKLNTELERLRDDVKRTRDIHQGRLWGLAALFVLIVIWLIVILRFVYWTGTPSNWHPDSKNRSLMVLTLSDRVVMALIGATTVNVLGLFYIAARWLYGESQKDENGK